MVSKSDIYIRRMLNNIRECKESEISSNGLIKEEKDFDVRKPDEKGFVIKKNTPQFGDIRQSQEDALVKTIGENITLGDNALTFYPKSKQLILVGRIDFMNIAFEFRYNDSSGEGCYIWANAIQLTDTNSRTLGKIRDAFVNWKNNLIQNRDLIDKLENAASRQ